jgi:predicted flap endonuclease-1-like 5' DNA nuclease
MATLESIEGIGPAYAQQLRVVGITTVAELLQKGATPKGRQEVAENSGISDKLILRWVNHADLFRITGVAEEFADLLEASGVDTIVELAQRNAENLYQKMVATNAEKKLVRKLPALTQVADWVAQAKVLPRVVSY